MSISDSDAGGARAPPIQALWYDGHSSRAHAATVQVIGGAPDAVQLLIDAGASQRRIPWREQPLSARVGGVRHVLTLPDGQSLEVLDGEAFDAALRAAGIRAAGEGVRRLERSWRAALVALLAIAAGSWAFLTYGVPALALRAVVLLPRSVDARIGVESLALLDRSTFSPTRLAPARQAQLRTEFAEICAGAAPDSAHYRLEFRRGGAVGANALALPSGLVVLTDELAGAAQDDELRGVLAHEVGHLVHRHAMRQVVQSSASALLMLGLLGDVTSASSLVAAVPGALVNAAYSREFERDADQFAYAWMRRHGVSPARLADLLARLSAAKGGGEGGWLATHPGLVERSRNAARAAR